VKLFCKLLGHTWVHQATNPKIRWTTAENLSELTMHVEEEVRFFERCVRCGAERPVTGPAGEVTGAR